MYNYPCDVETNSIGSTFVFVFIKRKNSHTTDLLICHSVFPQARRVRFGLRVSVELGKSSARAPDVTVPVPIETVLGQRDKANVTRAPL